MHAWILTLMLVLAGSEPPAPWAGTYEKSAAAIAINAHGASWTGAVLTAIAWDQSRFNPDALGDCAKGAQKSVHACQSLGMFQISKHWGPSAELLEPELAANTAARLVGTSVGICAKRSELDVLGWYAAGGVGCRGTTDSKRMMRIALSLLRDHPPPP